MGGGGIPYPQLEYIESNGTQWIDTGYSPNENTKVQLMVNNVSSTGEVIFGFIPPLSDWDSSDWRLFNYGNNVYYDIIDSRINGSTLNSGVWLEIELGNYYVKDIATGSTLISGDRKSTVSTTYTCTLNHSHQHNNNSSNKWRYVKIIEGNNLIMHLVAVMANLRPCMYDIVSRQLFDTPQGTFIAGPYI